MMTSTISDWREIAVALPDGLMMRGRRYGAASGLPTKTPILCMHGLTRNLRDFEELAPRLAALGHDVLAFSFRGRGASDFDPDVGHYHPATYLQDMLTALDQCAVEDAVLIGTSLGGIVAMLMHEAAPQRIRATIINDVGPELAPEGIARIAGYVGPSAPAQILEEAAARIKAINAIAFPDASDADWIAFAQRTFRQHDDGGWVLDYDPNIAKGLVQNGPAPDLWPAFKGLSTTPTLVIRGAISDLLSTDIIARMRAVNKTFDYAEVPRTGHAPMLTEAAAWDAIKNFLHRID